jgi:hypothetical protein
MGGLNAMKCLAICTKKDSFSFSLPKSKSILLQSHLEPTFAVKNGFSLFFFGRRIFSRMLLIGIVKEIINW